MIGNVCAVKRDVCRILETPYPVDLLQFKVDVLSSNTPLLSTEQLYSIKQEGENYYLFHLLTQLDFYIKISSSIEFWREGMDVVILNKNAMKVGTGRLIHKGIDMDKALTKEEILASDCVIKSEYQTQFDNASNTQLIPEKYLLKPSDAPALVTFYYDSRYLSVTRLNLSIYEIEEVEGSYSNLSEREIDKQISPLNQKSSSKSYIVCQIGDILKVEEKEHPDYEYGYLIIGGIWDYNSTSNVELVKSNRTSSLSFEITQDCFATFNVYSPRYKITASIPGGYTAPTDEGLVALLPDGYDFGFELLADGAKLPRYSKQGQKINLRMELANYPSDVSQDTLHYISPIVSVTYLENGVSTAKYLTPDKNFDVNTTISTCSFTMPAADCHLTVRLKLTGDGSDQFVEPTEGESGYALFVTGNIKSVIVGGFYHIIPATVIVLDKVNVSFTRKLGYSYTYSLYYTVTGTTIKSGVVLGDCIEVDVWNNLTLNILELETDCIYTSATGKLALDENWDNDNPIIGHNYYDNRSYAIDTENPLLTSGIKNTFRNKSVTQVTFNTTLDDFHIYNNAFKDCNILTTVSVNGPTSISIGPSAFENTTSLQKINGSENIIRLSEKSFKNSGLLEYNSNIEITNIPKYTFLDCDRLSNVSLHNSPLSSINERAFENCSNLKTISVPKCIKEIGVYSFSNSGIPAISTSTTPQLLAGCTFITDNGRTELSVIEEGVFKGCDRLVSASLPDSILYIDEYAFANDTILILFESHGLWHVARNSFINTILTDSKITYSLFLNIAGSYGLGFHFFANSEEIGKDVKAISSYILPNPNEDTMIFYKLLNRGYSADYVNGNLVGTTNCISIAPHACTGYNTAPSFTSVSFSPVLKEIGEYAFYKNKKLELIRGGQLGSVKTVNDCTILPYAFAECRYLREVHTTDWNLKIIKNNAFLNCCDLIPLNFCVAGTEYIGDYAFDNCCRYAYDRYNQVRIIANFILLNAAIAYTLLAEYCVISSIKTVNVPDPAEDLGDPIYKYNNVVDYKDTAVDGNGGPFESFTSYKYFGNDKAGAEAYMSLFNSMIDELKSSGIPALGINFRGDLSQYAEGLQFYIGDLRYAQLDYVDSFNVVPGYKFIGWRVTYPSIIVRTIITIGEKILVGYAKKASKKLVSENIKNLIEGATPYLTGIAMTAGFIPLMDGLNDLVWKLYDYPIDNYIDFPIYNLAISQGVGMRAERGIYDMILPENLNYLGKYAFRNCKDLKTVSFLSNPTMINEGVFLDCEFLTSVSMKKTITENGEVLLDEDPSYYNIYEFKKNAFLGCSLNPICVNKLLLAACRIEEYAFAYNFPLTVNFIPSPTLEELSNMGARMITLPPSLLTIDKYGLGGVNLVKFTTPDPTLLNIHKDAFNFYYRDYPGYNPYLGAMNHIFLVPVDKAQEYKEKFNEIGFTHTYRIVTYDIDGTLIEYLS